MTAKPDHNTTENVAPTAATAAATAAETTPAVAAAAATDNSTTTAEDKASATAAKAAAVRARIAAARKAAAARKTADNNATDTTAPADNKATDSAATKSNTAQADKITVTGEDALAASEGTANKRSARRDHGATTVSGVKKTLIVSAAEEKEAEAAVSLKGKQSSLFEIFIKGIWKDNPGLCQLLGMCPLLAVTTSAANALGLGIATIIVMVMSSFVISLIRRVIVPEVRIPIYVVVIASLVTVVRFEVEAYFPALYQQLGIYLSLIVTNCIIMGRAEAFAGHNNLIRSTVDAVACGIGFTLVLFALGSIREIIGNGTFFVGASDLLGSWAADLETTLFGQDMTMLIAILPPGGFFVLAFLIAAKNALDGRAQRKAERRSRIRFQRV